MTVLYSILHCILLKSRAKAFYVVTNYMNETPKLGTTFLFQSLVHSGLQLVWFYKTYRPVISSLCKAILLTTNVIETTWIIETCL